MFMFDSCYIWVFLSLSFFRSLFIDFRWVSVTWTDWVSSSCSRGCFSTPSLVAMVTRDRLVSDLLDFFFYVLEFEEKDRRRSETRLFIDYWWQRVTWAWCRWVLVIDWSDDISALSNCFIHCCDVIAATADVNNVVEKKRGVYFLSCTICDWS